MATKTNDEAISEAQTTIATIELENVLQDLGYGVIRSSDDTFSFEVVKGIPASITVGENPSTRNKRLLITCNIAKLGDFKEEDLPKLAFNCLDANTLTSPYAFALITSADDPRLTDPKDFLLVLTNEVPLEDLSAGELREALDTLHTALVTARETLDGVRRATRAKKATPKKPVAKKPKKKGKK